MSLDFLPHKKIEAFYKSNKKISSALPLPKRFIQEFLCAIMLEDKPMSKLNEEERMKLKQLKAYDFSPAGNFGYSKAEVTRGGIGTCEIESNTMQSKQHKNLFFLGECLDVTGQLGGYNFQFAWSSAYVCAQTILKQE
jgi:predicted flavoprotein YhiN